MIKPNALSPPPQYISNHAEKQKRVFYHKPKLLYLDNHQPASYSETTNSTGGAQGEFTGTERVRGLDENTLPVGQGMGFADGSGGQTSGRDSILRGFLNPTENINNAVVRTGATPLELRDTTGEPQLFSSALEQARQSNPHGLMVSGKV